MYLRPHPEERALARVSKDGGRLRCCVHPSRRLLRKLLRMRSEDSEAASSPRFERWGGFTNDRWSLALHSPMFGRELLRRNHAGVAREQNSPAQCRDLSRPVSYTHLRAHETRHDLVCRLLLEK